MKGDERRWKGGERTVEGRQKGGERRLNGGVATASVSETAGREKAIGTAETQREARERSTLSQRKDIINTVETQRQPERQHEDGR